MAPGVSASVAATRRHVDELAHVARPVVGASALERVVRLMRSYAGFRARCTIIDDEGGDVLEALAQRGQLDRSCATRKKRSLRNVPAFISAHEVAARGGDDADVDGSKAFDPPTLFTALLGERAQELRLHVDGELAELVEEERAAVGLGERADALVDGAGERAPLVAEEGALGERRGDGAAVDDDEGLARRGLASWMAWATSSLPVPVSPMMRTVSAVGAMRSGRSKTRRMPALDPRAARSGRCTRRRPGAGARLEAYGRAANLQHGGRGHDGLTDSDAAGERPVGAAEVADEDALGPARRARNAWRSPRGLRA